MPKFDKNSLFYFCIISINSFFEVRKLKYKIYVDILVSINLFINYFILLSVAKFLYIKINKFKLIAGATIGAFFSLYILFPQKNELISFTIKIMMSFLIVLIAFGFDKKYFLKSTICFIFMNILFSGFTLLIWFTFKPKGMIINNGIVYFNISPLILIISTLISYFLIEFINRFLGKHPCNASICHITIRLNEKSSEFDAKLDTGNSLKEPFSNLPVVLVDKHKIENIIPSDINNYNSSISQIAEKNNISIRIIPFSSVSNDGFLLGFKPDVLTIKTNSGNVLNKEAYVGISEQNLKYALVGPDILDIS